jgi:hypothetical protein
MPEVLVWLPAGHVEEKVFGLSCSLIDVLFHPGAVHRLHVA